MKRILLAFGDSHTAGAEIDEKYSGKCHDKAYPAHIAKHYGFDYENLAACGGSNDWMIRQFMIRIQYAISKKQSLFVICNFCDPSRTYIKIPGNLQHCTPSMLNQNEDTEPEMLVDPIFIRHYKNYLRTNDDNTLYHKSLSQIFIMQSICSQYNIPYVFHSSTHWYRGNWNLINKKNYLGHHATKNLIYNRRHVYDMTTHYSFWGVAINHPEWANIQKNPRWENHYPEEYHKFWAQTLINFTDKQGILDTGL